MPVWKRLTFALLALVLGLLILEGLTSVVWLILDYGKLKEQAEPVVSLKEDSHCRYDPELGWAHIPEQRIENFYAPGKHITINEAGVRGLTPITTPKPDGTFRLICLGDSFTMGYGVGDEETFPALLEKQHASLETVNMGQGGYSIGQCYLWYRRQAEVLNADAVVLSIIVADLKRLGIERTVNGYATPGFTLVEGEGGVDVTNVPVPPKLEVGTALVERRRRWEFLTEQSGLVRAVSSLTGDWIIREPDELETYAVGFEIIRELKRYCADRGEQFILVLLPTLQEYEDPGLQGIYQAVSDSLGDVASESSIPYLDLSSAFLKWGDLQALFLEEEFHHYSPQGNALVADELNRRLSQALEGYPFSIEKTRSTNPDAEDTR